MRLHITYHYPRLALLVLALLALPLLDSLADLDATFDGRRVAFDGLALGDALGLKLGDALGEVVGAV